jgi:hypothetical protein
MLPVAADLAVPLVAVLVVNWEVRQPGVQLLIKVVLSTPTSFHSTGISTSAGLGIGWCWLWMQLAFCVCAALHFIAVNVGEWREQQCWAPA